jgi:hypothetical protein
MLRRPAVVLFLLLAVGLIAGGANAFGQADEPGAGPAKPANPTPDAKFVVDDAKDVLGSGADLDDVERDHSLPFGLTCQYEKDVNSYTTWTWPVACKMTLRAATTRHVARILGLRSRVLAHGLADLPKVPVGQQPARNQPADDSYYHLPVSAYVRRHLHPVGYIKYVDLTGSVAGPRGEVVKLTAGEGDWGGRRTPGGIVCPSKDINLTIRPHNHAPYCPGGLGGVAGPGWYKG